MAGNITLEPGIDVVMPVPLHASRLRERGFNQALLLAFGICETHSLRLSLDNLARVRPTRPQVGLSGEERVANVAGAFALRRPEEVAEKGALLIDDVFTTGATLNECARVLKESGASRVLALTLARAV
jgi:ComF family protein